MEQLVFELAAPEPPTFANFLAGRNAELIDALTAFACGAGADTGMLIWGAAGVGKSHLARAALALARERGIATRLFAHPGDIAFANDASTHGRDDVFAQSREGVFAHPSDDDHRALAAATDSPVELTVVEGIDLADEAAAGLLFTLYNALRDRGGRLVATSRTPLAMLPLREDLRTRLGWGLVYELLPLSDQDKPAALEVYAKGRGFDLPDDVIDYLLRHGRRDMPSLLATLAALDRQSLATKRPITVPLLKGWLQRELEWKPAADVSRSA